MVAEVKYYRSAREYDCTFSVCSLVRDSDRYSKLLESFQDYGFGPENSEFLAADNRSENNFDGYTWHRRLHSECRGRYVIYCHEDVALIDHGFDDLVARLQELEQKDPDWLLAGVAGASWRPKNNRSRQLALRITDRHGADRKHGGPFPCRADTLDECFIVMRQDRPVPTSYDLSGFHFYGPDICLMAELLGGKSYVIDFHLRHDGAGTRGIPFRQAKRAFLAKYGKIYPGRSVHATTGVYHLGGAQ